jgi:predicted nucleic acid-binding protein
VHVIDLDANFLVGAVTPGTIEATKLAAWLTDAEPLGMSAVAWGEFLCGPLTPHDETVARKIIPRARALQKIDAERAAHLFNVTGRRSRSFADCCIAASAISAGARLATSNEDDFNRMLPHGLQLA